MAQKTEIVCDRCGKEISNPINGYCPTYSLYSLDLIKRQQTEIAELQHKNSELETEIERLTGRVEATEISKQKLLSCFKIAKSEAVKEFAKKVNTELDKRVSEKIRERNPHWDIAKRIVRETAIEMTEVSK